MESITTLQDSMKIAITGMRNKIDYEYSIK